MVKTTVAETCRRPTICIIQYKVLLNVYMLLSFSLPHLTTEQLIELGIIGASLGKLYTGCPGRNVPEFGRMFLKLKYNDIIKNTNIQI